MAFTPLATNELSSFLKHQFRNYYSNFYPSEVSKNNIDFWKQSMYYGRIDQQVDNIVFKQASLKPLKLGSVNVNSSNSLSILNFVYDAWQDFNLEVKKADFSNLIPKSKFNPLIPKKAAADPTVDYRRYSSSILDAILSGQDYYIVNNSNNIREFLNIAINALYYSNNIITLTGFMNSYSNPLHSGLAIEFSNASHSDDTKKNNDFLQDPNYQFYLNTAERYGFYVDKNAPWRIVFNVSTNYCLEKLRPYNITSLSGMFETNYEKTYLKDIKILKELFTNLYLVSLKRKSQNQSYKVCQNNNLKINTIDRERDTTVDDLTWINIYYYLRLGEQNIKISQNTFIKNLKTISDLYRLKGEAEATKFINNSTKSFLDGGRNPSYTQYLEVTSNRVQNSNIFMKI
jgi:hypothetical protein